jgi:hypothetical protein
VRLERYAPDDWPEGPQAWYDACAEWHKAHPDIDVPTVGPYPDVPWTADDI